MKSLRFVPNALTLGNGFCGVLGIVYAMQGYLVYAALFIYLAAVLDFLDGFAARILHAKSPIGGQLDSLCDAVTFGVLPSLMFYKMLQIAYSKGATAFDIPILYLIPALALALCAIYRLAKFNIDTRQAETFIGMPTPAMAMFTAALPFFSFDPALQSLNLTYNPTFLYITIILLSYLMISPLRMLSLKFSTWAFSGVNIWRYVLIIIGAAAIIFLKFAASGFIIIMYVLLSIIQHFSTSNKQTN